MAKHFYGSKQEDDKRVSEIIEKRDSMKSVMDTISVNWSKWVKNVEGKEETDAQGKPKYNSRIEAQFLDTYIAKFTRQPEFDIIPEGPEDRVRVETIKTMFSKVWEDGRMTHKEQQNLRQEGTLGLSLVHIGTDFTDNLVKVKVPTGVDENGDETFEEKEYHDKRTEIYKEVVDMRNVYMYNMQSWSDVRELVWETWVLEGEWTEKFKNNPDYKNLEDLKPGARDEKTDSFFYPAEGGDEKAIWYKITKYYQEPSGNKEGDKYEIVVNDHRLIYSGELPNQGFSGRQKKLPFALRIHKQKGLGILNVTGIPEEIEQPAKIYNSALHTHRLGAAMSSIGFMTLHNASLVNSEAVIYTGVMLETEGEGKPEWNKAPPPGPDLLQVANDAYENMVRITGFDPRSSVVAQKVTTAFQRASEEKAQAERLDPYDMEDQLYHQDEVELILAAIIQHGAELDVEKTAENLEKGKLEPVYRSITFKDVKPVKKNGKVIGLQRKKGVGEQSITVTPDMLDISAIVRVKTSQNRPIFELSDRQLENEYLSNTLVPLLQAAPMLEQRGFDVDSIIEKSMFKNNVNLKMKQKTPKEKSADDLREMAPAGSGLQSQLKLQNAENQGIDAVAGTGQAGPIPASPTPPTEQPGLEGL